MSINKISSTVPKKLDTLLSYPCNAPSNVTKTETNVHKQKWRASLSVQWLRLCASTEWGMSSIPGWGTIIMKSHKLCSMVKNKRKYGRVINCQHLLDHRKREFQKNIYFYFIDYAKAFDCVDHNKLWKILKEKGIPDYLTCLLRNLYADQEATVRTGHGTTD